MIAKKGEMTEISSRRWEDWLCTTREIRKPEESPSLGRQVTQVALDMLALTYFPTVHAENRDWEKPEFTDHK